VKLHESQKSFEIMASFVFVRKVITFVLCSRGKLFASVITLTSSRKRNNGVGRESNAQNGIDLVFRQHTFALPWQRQKRARDQSAAREQTQIKTGLQIIEKQILFHLYCKCGREKALIWQIMRDSLPAGTGSVQKAASFMAARSK
jgi:hypothetical protein